MPTQVYPSMLTPPGTLGAGVIYDLDQYGEIQAIPYTGTPPFGERPLRQATLDDQPEQAGDATYQRVSDRAAETFLHDQINGVPWHGYAIEEVVNGANPGIPNLGPINEQPFQSGHTQVHVDNPSSEQGWGLDPAVLYARYPRSDGANPCYAMGTHRRNGTLDWQAPGVPFSDWTNTNWQLQWQLRRQSGTHQRVVDPTTGIPFVSTVPVSGQAGPLELIPDAAIGVYP